MGGGKALVPLHKHWIFLKREKQRRKEPALSGHMVSLLGLGFAYANLLLRLFCYGDYFPIKEIKVKRLSGSPGVNESGFEHRSVVVFQPHPHSVG